VAPCWGTLAPRQEAISASTRRAPSGNQGGRRRDHDGNWLREDGGNSSSRCSPTSRVTHGRATPAHPGRPPPRRARSVAKARQWWTKDADGDNQQRVEQWAHHPERPYALRGIILYPLNALVEDQLRRLRRTLESPDVHNWLDQNRRGNRILFGRYTGQSAVSGRRFRRNDNGDLKPNVNRDQPSAPTAVRDRRRACGHPAAGQ